jgi:hypothetical protein
VPAIPRQSPQASFVTYLHYLEDLAGIIGGRFGVAESLVHGIYESFPPATSRPVPAEQVRRLNDHLGTAWLGLLRLEQLTRPAVYDRQANAVVPRFAFEAVVAGVRALAAAEGVDLADDHGDALDYAGGRISEGVLPFPWSSRCAGCPQAGTDRLEDVVPGEVHLFTRPDPSTSQARLALLLRTTRTRALERSFAEARQRDVRPGRTRRNLSWSEKEQIAAATAPTTLLDVFARLHERAAADAGDVFADGPADEVEAFRFAEALRLLTDATVAALEAATASSCSWELMGDLVASQLRRTGGDSPTLRRRVAGTHAAARLQRLVTA